MPAPAAKELAFWQVLVLGLIGGALFRGLLGAFDLGPAGRALVSVAMLGLAIGLHLRIRSTRRHDAILGRVMQVVLGILIGTSVVSVLTAIF
jgi:hypothetical protein